jgi:hypothetical protein
MRIRQIFFGWFKVCLKADEWALTSDSAHDAVSGRVAGLGAAVCGIGVDDGAVEFGDGAAEFVFSVMGDAVRVVETDGGVDFQLGVGVQPDAPLRNGAACR